MSELKCTANGYSSEIEANQCRAKIEAETGRPHEIRLVGEAVFAGKVLYMVQGIPNCFKGLSVFDDLFGNGKKAEKCQKELTRITGVKHEIILVRSGSLMFDNDYEVAPVSGAPSHGLSRLFGHILSFPMGHISP